MPNSFWIQRDNGKLVAALGQLSNQAYGGDKAPPLAQVCFEVMRLCNPVVYLSISAETEKGE